MHSTHGEEADVTEWTHHANSVSNELKYPGHNCCTFYESPRWQGATSFKACLPSGKSTVTANVPSDHLNKANSYWCGKSLKYDFCYGTRD